MRVVALMPMKAISERVPGKNLKKFDGRPLYSVMLDVLLRSKYIQEVIINTDGEDLKNSILERYPEKVLVLNRKEEICGNYVSMNKIIEHDINAVEADIYVQTHSTNPLLKVESIDRAIEKMLEKLKENELASVFSVTKVQKRFYTKDAKPLNHDPKMLVTQHLEPMFEENSCFYVFTKKSFLDNDSRIGRYPYMIELDKIESTDIDDPEDFIIAEALYKLLRS